jgi:hypothetical protein
MLFALLVSAFAGFGQKVSSDSIPPDSTKRFFPTGIRVGTDLISLVKDRRQENFAGWEMNADVDFHRYLLAAEVGKWQRDFPGDSAGYHNEGNYWRAGVDVNFLTRDPDRNVFFLGMRYAHSKYSETMSLIAVDSIFGVNERDYVNNDIKAGWFELTVGLKVKIWKFIWMGYTARLKTGLNKDDSQEMLSHDIPGYGSTSKDATWGFNYYLMARIPLRKSTPILPKAKKKKK